MSNETQRRWQRNHAHTTINKLIPSIYALSNHLAEQGAPSALLRELAGCETDLLKRIERMKAIPITVNEKRESEARKAINRRMRGEQKARAAS